MNNINTKKTDKAAEQLRKNLARRKKQQEDLAKEKENKSNQKKDN